MNKNIQRNMERVAVRYQPYVSRSIALLSVVLAASVFLYSVFLLEAVAHAASKTSAEHQLVTIGEHLSMLEGQYLALTQSLTPQKAALLGFVTPVAVVSVYAQKEGSQLSFVPR